jgi:hypothetical protein
VIAEFERPEDLVSAGHAFITIMGTRSSMRSRRSRFTGSTMLSACRGRFSDTSCSAAAPVRLLNAIFMIWYTNGHDYPLVIGGKPTFAWEFSIPPMFELTILLSAFGAVFGMFALNGLPKFYHPVFKMKGSERAPTIATC